VDASHPARLTPQGSERSDEGGQDSTPSREPSPSARGVRSR
jgi:hypothetical protein